MSPGSVSHYEFLVKLGEGGMGVVWKVRDTRLNRFVAIKTLLPDKLADEDRKRRFIQEAQAASALNHPNIVIIYDIASEAGKDFIVMEYVDGKMLGQLIPRRGMRLDELLRYSIQIADGLARAHSAGIIHRDLKPGNIMVTSDGHVKLLDFGLAKLTEPTESIDYEHTRTIAARSVEGVIIGTAAYMSPEQAEGKPVDARSDIFSFGAVLYEMATGTRAFQGDSSLSTLSAVLRDNPQRPSELVADIPRELDRIITRCLRKDPRRRFQAMPDLRVALEELKEESDSGTAEISVVPVSPPAKTPVKTALAIGAIVLIAAGGFAWSRLRSVAKPMPPMRAVPITSYPGSQQRPSLSPDGNQVAFQWGGEKNDNSDIYVKLVDGGEPLRLTTNPAADVDPAWSPDGRQIAFVRQGSVYSISPLGGAERKLTDAQADGLAWTPDGQSLLISSGKSQDAPHSIFLLSLRTGEMRKITSPPENVIGGDITPAVSPDGQTLAFFRLAGALGGSGDIYAQPLSGTTRRLSKSSQQFVGLTWTSNREIVFCRGALTTSSMWRLDVGGSSDPEPVQGALDGARYPTMVRPPAGPARLVFERVNSDINIWHMEIAPDGEGRPRIVREPAPLIESTRTENSPQFSPDGKRIVFGSDRDGYREIWASASDGSNPSQLTTLKSPRTGSPHWSADGNQIVFDSLGSGHNDIWIVGSEGGSPKQVTKGGGDNARPTWSHDGRWIYFRSDRSGTQQIWKIPSSEPYGPAVQVTRQGGFEVLDSPDSKLLYFTKNTPVLYSVPVEGGEEKPVFQPVTAGSWAVAETGIYFFDFSHPQESNVPIEWFRFATQKVIQVGTIAAKTLRPLGNPPNLSVTSDGRRIVWAQMDRLESNLMLIDNFR